MAARSGARGKESLKPYGTPNAGMPAGCSPQVQYPSTYAEHNHAAAQQPPQPSTCSASWPFLLTIVHLPSIAHPQPTQRAHVGGPDHAAVFERAAHQVCVVNRLAAAQLVRCVRWGGGGQGRAPAQLALQQQRAQLQPADLHGASIRLLAMQQQLSTLSCRCSDPMACRWASLTTKAGLTGAVGPEDKHAIHHRHLGHLQGSPAAKR